MCHQVDGQWWWWPHSRALVGRGGVHLAAAPLADRAGARLDASGRWRVRVARAAAVDIGAGALPIELSPHALCGTAEMPPAAQADGIGGRDQKPQDSGRVRGGAIASKERKEGCGEQQDPSVNRSTRYLIEMISILTLSSLDLASRALPRSALTGGAALAVPTPSLTFKAEPEQRRFSRFYTNV